MITLSLSIKEATTLCNALILYGQDMAKIVANQDTDLAERETATEEMTTATKIARLYHEEIKRQERKLA